MRSVPAIIFWLSLLALVYGYAGFPLLVAAVGKLRNRVVRRAPVTPTMLGRLIAISSARDRG